MRNFQSYLKKSLPAGINLPNFPKKKYFQNLDNNFLKGREKQLENFFNNFLSNQNVVRSKLVPIYFEEHASDQQSQQKIIELVAYLEKPGMASTTPK